MPKCIGTNKDGSPCQRPPSVNSEYCSAHEPDQSNGVCSHENLHFVQNQPDQDALLCEKETGHPGNHGALVHVVRYDAEGTVTEDDWVWQEWSDIAGIPVSEIKPEKKGKTRFDVYDTAWEPVNP